MSNEFIFNVRAAGPTDTSSMNVRVTNALEIGNAIVVADVASLPTPSLTFQGLIFFAKVENTYHTVNDAGDGYDPAVKPLGGASETIQHNWAFDSTATDATDPGSKKFKFNNDTPASVTAIYVSHTSNSGSVVSTIFDELESGDKLYIQQIDAFGKNILFNVTGRTNNGAWSTITVGVDSSIGGLFGNGKDCAYDFDWTSNVGGGAIKQVEKIHIVTDATSWKAAIDDINANPGKKINTIKVQNSFTLANADESSGNMEGIVNIIADTSSLANRPKITDNKYRINMGTATVFWQGVDYLSVAADNDGFFVGTANNANRYEFRDSDFSRDNDRSFIGCGRDAYSSALFINCTGTDSAATSEGFVSIAQTDVGAPISLFDLVMIGCNFSGILADTDNDPSLINITLINSIISNGISGVWNANSAGDIVVSQDITSQVARDIVGASAAITFKVNGTPEDWSFFISDQDSDLTVNTALSFPATKKRRLLVGDIPSVTLRTAQTGSTSTYDILIGGVSVFSTVISIDDGQKTSVTATTPAVLDPTKTLINIGDLVEFKILTVGTTIKGAGAKLNIPNLIEA